MKRFFDSMNGNLNEKIIEDQKDNPIEKRNLLSAEKKLKKKRESEDFKDKLLSGIRPKSSFGVRFK
jgi:hypothetical protein